MKQWLNNWERRLAERLRHAESRPGNHIWDQIEQELDSSGKKPLPPVFRRSAVVAAVSILLIAASGVFLLNTPDGEPAYTIDNTMFPGDRSGWTLFNSDRNDSGENLPLRGTVTQRIVRTEHSTAASAGANTETASLETEDAAPGHATLRSEADVLPSEEFAGERMTAELAVLEMEGSPKYIAKPLSEQDLDYELNILGTQERLRNRELLNRIASHTELHGGLLVQAEEKQISVIRQINQLAEQPVAVMMDVALDDEMAVVDAAGLTEALAAYEFNESDEEELVRDIQETVEISNAVEAEMTIALEEVFSEEMMVENTVAAEVSEATWMETALVELEQWKAEVDKAIEEEDELEQLIEKAEIDEEDPLTKQQNATKDLYRAHNINKGFHIGTVTGFTSTWVTRASRNPEVDRSYVDYRFNPGYQVGLNMGYDITEHFGLMMEFKYSDEGGRYFHPLRNKEQQIDLRYVEVPVYAKVKHSKLSAKMRPLVFNYILGVTFSDLRTINVSNGGRDQRFGQDYNTSLWGLSGGFDFDFYINKNFFWTFGSRVGVSGDAKAFPRFNDEDGGPLNISAGLYTRFNFRLPGK